MPMKTIGPPPPLVSPVLDAWRPTAGAHGPSYSEQTPIAPRIKKNSSPIDPGHDDYDLVQRFFEWRLDNITNPAVKSMWTKALEVVQSEAWTIEDLKDMSVRGGELWKFATLKGIPDGIAVSFQSYLRQFKDVYRQSH
jgi:hypothetical protein